MTNERLIERIKIKRRLDQLLRLQSANPSTASWFDEPIAELVIALRTKSGRAINKQNIRKHSIVRNYSDIKKRPRLGNATDFPIIFKFNYGYFIKNNAATQAE